VRAERRAADLSAASQPRTAERGVDARVQSDPARYVTADAAHATPRASTSAAPGPAPRRRAPIASVAVAPVLTKSEYVRAEIVGIGPVDAPMVVP
jgi:hypothetical protein